MAHPESLEEILKIVKKRLERPSKNSKKHQKMSKRGQERSSLALDESGCIKIALRTQWNASRTSKTPLEN